MKKQKSFLKRNKKWVGGVAQVVEQLPSNCEALSLNPNTAKKHESSRVDAKEKVSSKLYDRWINRKSILKNREKKIEGNLTEPHKPVGQYQIYQSRRKRMRSQVI
jgi:hypothetical protein